MTAQKGIRVLLADSNELRREAIRRALKDWKKPRAMRARVISTFSLSMVLPV
jgi:hypothetical protein